VLFNKGAITDSTVHVVPVVRYMPMLVPELPLHVAVSAYYLRALFV
jgi:hypothetical protein